MGYVVVGIICFVAGGTAVWIWRNAIVSALQKELQEAKAALRTAVNRIP